MANGGPDCCAKREAVAPPPARERETTETFARSAAEIRRRWSGPIGGRFLMGTKDRRFPDDGEGPVRDVTLTPFEIACHAVSNLQFGDFVRETGYTTDAERYGWSFVFEGLLTDAQKVRVLAQTAETPWWLQIAHAYWAQPEGPGSTVLDRLDHPVVHVSWNDARAYCQWSNSRLPTEAEWEMAARGGLPQATYPWGDELMPGGDHRCNIWQGEFPRRNTGEDGFNGTAPVHAFEPNGYGLHNAAGNVWEWCADHFTPEYHRVTSAHDPLHREASPLRSLRGGSFLCHESYCNRYRVGARSSNTPDTGTSNIGFRVVRGNAGR